MRRSWDLILLVGLAVAQVGLAMLPPGADFARVVFGTPFVLFAPGYALTAAARPNDRGHLTERVVLSLGLSFAVTVLGGLLLNLTQAGLTRETWIALLGVVTILGGLIAALRRRADAALPLPRPDVRGSLALLGAGMLAFGGYQLAAYGAVQQDQSQGFSQLWILSPDGAPNATGAVQVGLRNLEVSTTTYRLQVLAEGELAVDEPAITLAPGATWETTVPAATASGRLVEAVVFRENDQSPYRRVRLAAVPNALADQEDG
jgi:uncharacterized membrane protein